MPFLVPIIASIASGIVAGGAAIGITVTVATATTLATTLLVSAVLSAVEWGLGKLLHPSVKTDAATSQVSIRQPISYRRIIYGSVRVAGVITFVALSGTDNTYLHMVLTLTGHQVHAINTMYFDGVEVPMAINGGGATDGAYHPTSGKFYQHVQVEKDLGDPTNTSQPFPLLATDISASWTSAHKQRGCAKVHIRFKWDPDVYPQGAPSSIAFDIDGKEVYDPRLSPPGLAFSNNPALCLRDFLQDDTFGMAVDTAAIDDDAVIAAANVCDEAMDLREGGTQARYTCDGAFDTSVARGQVISSVASSMEGVVVPPGDSWLMFPGAYREPILDLTDDDLRGPIKMDTRVSRRDLSNGIKGTYVSPTNNWQPSDFPPYLSSDYVDEDGGEVLWGDVTLDFVTNPVRAQRLAKIHLEKIRRQAPLLLQAKIKAFKATPGDTITFTHSRFGFDAKTYMVTNTSLVVDSNTAGPVLGCDLALVAVDDLVYAWDPDVDEGTVEVVTAPLLPSSRDVGAPTSLVLLSDITTSIVRLDGIAHSQIFVSWTPTDDAHVLQGGFVEIFIKEQGADDSTYVLDGRAAGDASSYIIDKNITDGVVYTIKVIDVNTHGAHSTDIHGDVTCDGAISDVAAGGSTEIFNYDFEFSDALTPAPAGWEVTQSGSPIGDDAMISFDTTTQFQGVRSVKITTDTQFAGIRTTRKYYVIPGDFFTGDQFKASGQIKGDGTGNAAISFVLFDIDDNQVGSIDATAGVTPTDWTQVSLTGYVPSESVYGRFYCWNLTGSGPTVELEFDELNLLRLASLEDEVHDGPTRGAITAANTSYRPLTNPLTAHDDGADCEIDIASFTMRVAMDLPGGHDVSVNSGVVSGLDYATTYHVYYDDPAYQGGAVTYHADTVQEISLDANGRFYVGSIMTPVVGGADTVGNNDGGTGAQTGQLYLISPSLRADDTVDPVSWYPSNFEETDGDNSSYVDLTTVETIWLGGFPNIYAKWRDLKLKVRSEVVSIGQGGVAFADYSLDDGITWTNIFNVAYGTSDVLPVATGANSGSGTAWVNPGNVASDTNYATITGLAQNTSSKYLFATNAGFAEPSGATPVGIHVSFDTTRTAGETGGSYVVQLLKAGVQVGTVKTVDAADASTVELGDTNYLWGTTWAYTDINDTNFGVSIQAVTPPSITTTWVASTYYSPEGLIIDSNGALQRVTTAGLSGGSTPSWQAAGSGVGTTTTDGTVVWTKLQTAASLTWAAHHQYAIGDYVKATAAGTPCLFRLTRGPGITIKALGGHSGTPVTLQYKIGPGTVSGHNYGHNGDSSNSGWQWTYGAFTPDATAYVTSLLVNPTNGASYQFAPFKVATLNGAGEVTGTTQPVGGAYQQKYGLAMFGTFIVPEAQTVSFRVHHDDGFIMGIGGGATRVSGSLHDNWNHVKTTAQGYPIMGSHNDSGDLTDIITVRFPAAGEYGFEFDYSQWENANTFMVTVGYNLVPDELLCSAASAPTWPAWTTVNAPNYPSVFDNRSNLATDFVSPSSQALKWINVGPAADFVWSASTNFTLAGTTILDTNGNGQKAYRTGKSALVTQPVWATGVNQLSPDLANLIWINTTTTPPPLTMDFAVRNVILSVTYLASGAAGTRSLTTDEVTLPLTQTMNKVQVRYGNVVQPGSFHVHEVVIEGQT